jgi:preprotein translocase subunit SecB
MIPSPLHLDSYFFTKILMEACPQGCDSEGDGTLGSYLEFSRHQDDTSKWMVQLGIRKMEDEDEGCPEYTFELEVVGLFEVDNEYPTEKVESMVRANAPAVLYGAIREMVANLTARGPFAAVELPTVSFIDEAKKPVKKMAPKRRRRKEGS